MRINLDSDGCIYDLQSVLIGDARELMPDREFRLPTQWELEQAWDVPSSFIYRLFGQRSLYFRGEAYPDAIDAVRYLESAGHDLRVVTHKHGMPNVAEAITDTAAWYQSVGLLDLVDLVIARGDKTAYPADVVVDDKPNLAWAQPNALNILMDRPWNRGVHVGSNVRRALGWNHVEILIEEYAWLQS